jgi:two-component system response regulator HydG
MRHDWPGNVRELRHCIEAAAASARFDHVTTMDLPEAIRGDGVCPDPPAIEPLPLSVVERDHILGVLESVGGNKAQAAKLLGLDRKTLHRRLKQYAVAEDQDRGG